MMQKCKLLDIQKQDFKRSFVDSQGERAQPHSQVRYRHLGMRLGRLQNINDIHRTYTTLHHGCDLIG